MLVPQFSEVQMDKIITHFVGNKQREEMLFLAPELTRLAPQAVSHLRSYLFGRLPQDEIFVFTHPVSLEMNDVLVIAASIFTNHSEEHFISASQSLARLLFEKTEHPLIKSGHLSIVYLKNAILDDEMTDAIGIFKSESESPFIKFHQEEDGYLIQCDMGFDIKGLDKGCIIYNTDRSDGYKVILHDNVNKTGEAAFWKDGFLELKPLGNKFFQTSQYMAMTKRFVEQELHDAAGFQRTDQIDILNKSVNYFKTNDLFSKTDFEQKVLADSVLIDQFRSFDKEYRRQKGLDIPAEFEISDAAVKKQASTLRRILKLDKNFHIYIHGPKALIEKGVDPDGRKFYKLYYIKDEG